MSDSAQAFDIYSGKPASIIISVVDDNGAAVDISTALDFVWTVRSAPGSDPLLTKSKTGGGADFVTEGTDGKVAVSLTGTDSAALSGYYVYDAVLIDGSGNPSVVATGRLQVLPGPAWTYSGDPASSDKDKVRYLVGDTAASGPLVMDPEIAFALTQRGSAYGAAALICRSLAARFAREADTGDRDMRTNLSQRAASFRAMAKDYESQASEKSALVFVAGLPGCFQQ